MSFPTYKEVLPQEISWENSFPAHWKTMQLKRTVENCQNGIWGSDPLMDGSDTIVLRVADFDRTRLIVTEDKLTHRQLSNKEKKPRMLNYGDLLIEKSGGGEKQLVGQVVLFDKEFEAVTSNFVARMAPNNNHSSRFLNYIFARFYALRINYCSIKQNTGIQNLDTGQYLQEAFALPPLEEQQAIATFLDHETARIDTLIEKQEKLIALLKEKRQAVISHAVTKGLDPTAPMKESGVEWLGEVPEHWSISRSKFCFDFVTSGSRGWAQYYSDSGELFFRITNLNRNSIDLKLNKIRYVTPPAGAEGERSRIQIGDLLISITADLGSIGVATTDVENGFVSQHVALCRTKAKSINSRWLGYVLISDHSKQQFLTSGYGGTKVQLSLVDVREIVTVIPPFEEQSKISQFLDERLQKLDVLADRIQHQILLLQERRTALISAAVTGKIDVRNPPSTREAA